MPTQKAVIQNEVNGKQTLTDIEKHKPEKGEVLIRVHVVATNPVDYKVARSGYFVNGRYPFISGLDVAGTIDEVGEGVTILKKGDPVFAWLDVLTLFNIKEGGFQEFTIAKADYTAVKPSNFSFEEAACLGLPALTAAVGLYSITDLHLPYPKTTSKPNITEESPVFFVNGGSSAVGSAAVQFAALSGFRVISTSSPKNFDFVKSLGATEVFDYNDSDLVAKVKKSAGKNVSYVYDASSNAVSVKQGVDILNKQGGLVTVLSPPKDLDTTGIHVHHVFTNNVLKDAELTKWYFPYLRQIAENGQFIVNKPEVVAHGLTGEEVQKVLDYHSSGKVSASRPILKVI